MAKERGTHKTHKPVLSELEVKFALAVAAGKNHTEAYTSTFPTKDTPQANWAAASRVVRKRQVRELIRAFQANAADAAQITVNCIVQGFARLAFFDIRRVFDDRGRILLPCQWTDDVAAGVLSVESEELFEYEQRTDPATGKSVRCKVLIGYVRKVKRVNPTEPMKVLAQILRMIGQDADAGKAPPAPLVIGGDARPDVL